MHILQIATELAPVAKVGGLGDVLYGLSQELAKQNHTVEILLPKYDCIDYTQLKHLKVEMSELLSFEGGHCYNNTIWSAELHNLKLLLLEPHHPKHYFGRGVIYGCPDDIERFLYFSRTALEYLHKANKRPDILHLHDWPVAAIAPLYKEIYAPSGFHVGGTMLTIHNLDYQGKCTPQALARIGLRSDTPLLRQKLQDPLSPSTVNLLKAGIEYADCITTVSPTYEKEIETDPLLVGNRHKFKGILNGIDTQFWNPETDPLLVARYPTDNVQKLLEGKRANRAHLSKHLSLAKSKAPLVVSITRIVPQKGPELIHYALQKTLNLGAQFVMLGSNHHTELEKMFIRLQKELKNNKDAAICLDKDEALAHLIFAAADMIVIPSIFEPCGLTQLIALRYGTVPLVRSTGGLADTVFDIDTSQRPIEQRNGFTFEHATHGGIDWALERAVNCFKTDQKKWQMLMQHGLKMDFSWGRSAKEYSALYASVCQAKSPTARAV